MPPEWEATAAEILARRWRTILVIGASDLGKSSFCRNLAAAIISKQSEVAVVDADIGQTNLGPPAAIALGYPTSPGPFSAVPPVAYFFVGSTNPVGRLLPLVIGTASLVREAHAPFVIVDTTGLIHAAGRILKNYKIEAVRPDVIVAIERRNELASIRAANRHLPIIRLKPSRAAHKKDDYEKIEVRQRSYRRYFGGAPRIALPLDSLIFQRTLLFTGRPIELEGAVHAERTAEGPLIVGAPVVVPPDSILLPFGFEQNLLCGVADRTGRCLGLGIIEGIDFSARTISLSTPVESSKVRIIQFGDMYVRADGTELAHLKRAW